ncbi:Protoporphyrinogen IX dehydrogenase [menaquinone] [Sinobacterium norvegicum]|uniref:Protoporphyrinogen IX dehydrogenase [quinone] n=1 Tax=Sinobacterium norvegicum TaxID=1641715 RepID=A0ABN8EJZ5_9GAMM|nr:menaquinone-dependent protoporphyrinogen IX dehydrogenase [Sinobacterium norvegicum]CAH0992748.1 Protoporphyrinogen IX dehydrogenase [menaquinone] [Sinobacterium norvegicum]
MTNTLLIYASCDGHTKAIAAFVERIFSQQDTSCQCVSLTAIDDINLTDFNCIILGASIRYGTHGKAVEQFVRRNLNLLNKTKSVFFSVNLVARKANKNTIESNPYARKLLQQSGWQPLLANVFAGKLNYPDCGFFDRHFIRLIMKLTGGPTDPNSTTDFTDWQAVDNFARDVIELVTQENTR